MISVTFQLKNVTELKKLTDKLGGIQDVAIEGHDSGENSEPIQPQVQTRQATKPAAKKGGRPAKSTAKSKGSKAATEENAEEDTSPEEITQDDVIKVLTELSVLKGTLIARSALTKYKAKKVSDIATGDYAQFVEVCKSFMLDSKES